MSVSTIRAALQTRLASITGLRTHAVWPDQVSAPAAIVRPAAGTFAQTFEGGTALRFEIVLLAAPVDVGLAAGQIKLDAYLDESGASSVKAALEADPTLGGTASYVTVLGWRDYGALEVNGMEFLGCRFDVEVAA